MISVFSDVHWVAGKKWLRHLALRLRTNGGTPPLPPVSSWYAIAQLVEALRYKPEGRGFDTRWCHWNFSLALSFWPHYGPGLTQPLKEMSTRNISWGVKATGAQGWQPYHLNVPTVLKSGSLNLLEPSGPIQACNGIAFYDRLACSIIYVMFCVQKNIPKNCIPVLSLKGKNNNNIYIYIYIDRHSQFRNKFQTYTNFKKYWGARTLGVFWMAKNNSCPCHTE
jgi:hypothetical protein